MGRVYKKGQIVFAAIAIPLVTVVVLAWLSSFGARAVPLPIGLTFAFTGFWAIARILTDFAPYSLNKMHWYFILVFMVMAPMLHYLSGWSAWGYSLSDGVILRANEVVILWCIFYEIGRLISGSRSKSRRPKRRHLTLDIPGSPSFRLALLALSAVSFAALVALVGFSSLAVRGEASLDGENNPLFTVLNILLRAIPAISTVVVLLQMKRGRRARRASEWFVLGALLAMTVIANNPVSQSRFWTAAVYLGIAIAALPESWLRNGRFDFIVIVGLLVVFPMMSAFKTMTLEDFLAQGDLLSSLDLADSFRSIDFDAYSLLCRVLLYCDVEGFTCGRQLLSVVFFFMPRAVLPIKGTPTGELVSSAQGQWYTNLSAPIMSEGYIDFGILGVLVYAVAIGWFMRTVDDRYWLEDDHKRGSVPFFMLIYLVLFGFVIYIMRGALQPTFLRLMGFLLFILLLYAAVEIVNSLVAANKEPAVDYFDGEGKRTKTVVGDD